MHVGIVSPGHRFHGALLVQKNAAGVIRGVATSTESPPYNCDDSNADFSETVDNIDFVIISANNPVEQDHSNGEEIIDDHGSNDEENLNDDAENTTKSSSTRKPGGQPGRSRAKMNRVSLSLQQKYDIIKYFEETKTNYGGKSMSLNELGQWAMNRFGDVLKNSPSKASLCHVLKTKADVLLRHNISISEKGKQRKRQRRSMATPHVFCFFYYSIVFCFRL